MSPGIRIESFPKRNGPQIAGVIARYTGMYGVDELLKNLPAQFEVEAGSFEALKTELDQLGCNRRDVISPDTPDTVVQDPRLRPQYKLYSLAAIDLATFLGSALAGMFLLAGNLRRLGDPDSARNVLFLGLGIFFAFALVIISIPKIEHIPGIVFQLLQVGIVHAYASWKQEKALDQHKQRGGDFHSRWRAAGMGLLATPVVIGIFVAAAVLTETKVDFGTNEVYYENGATEDDARKLGTALENMGVFREGEGLSVQIEKTTDGFAVSFVVQDGAWNKEEVVQMFRGLRTYLILEVFDSPVEVRLCDSWFNVKRVIKESKSL